MLQKIFINAVGNPALQVFTINQSLKLNSRNHSCPYVQKKSLMSTSERWATEYM